MKFSHALALTLVLGISGSVTRLHAADEPTTQTTKTKKEGKGPRVTGVYAKLDDLTADQKTKIAAIHKASLEDKRKIEAKEEDDIKALLTDEQKTQLATLKEDASVKRKGEKKTDDTPATQPAKDGM